ncbi:acyl-CoA thioesterase [Proteiniborus sp. MB09-C3]|uniref:acyl-CoA thioesterase n=1 Tax=Proteiniborus sp. MB09-C3 TaxID=3050072 RepID=UPI0025549FD8|nr:acyl-CoA thioesterase [Proteiniborus sp. MB09-C3]WIV12440.1 acyl-CoA thioesterase [Proteiniborus sp. MB09-C3]
MQPNQANIAGNVHGGEIMKLMDNVAGIVAAKHARSNVVTARVDKLEFHYPIKIGNLVTCQAKLSFVGNSSMEVFVKVLVEDVTKEASAKVVSTAFFTMVALDEYGKPMTVPSLEITSDEESDLFDEGKKRYLTHKQELNK